MSSRHSVTRRKLRAAQLEQSTRRVESLIRHEMVRLSTSPATFAGGVR